MSKMEEKRSARLGGTSSRIPKYNMSDRTTYVPVTGISWAVPVSGIIAGALQKCIIRRFKRSGSLESLPVKPIIGLSICANAS